MRYATHGRVAIDTAPSLTGQSRVGPSAGAGPSGALLAWRAVGLLLGHGRSTPAEAAVTFRAGHLALHHNCGKPPIGGHRD
jgi:hypothetical protein